MELSPSWVTLARIERSRGRKGEVLAESFTSGPERFEGVSVVLLGPDGPLGGGQRYPVEQAWSHDGRLVLKLAGIDTINAAESLRGLEVCVPFTERAPLADGEVYLTDLVDCTVIDLSTDTVAGVVTGWQQNGGAPVLLEVRTPDGREALVPYVRAICVETDLPNRRILARLPEGLLDLDK